MKEKLNNFLKNFRAKITSREWWTDLIPTLLYYLCGLIAGVICTNILHNHAKWTWHGEDTTLHDGDFFSYDKKNKKWFLYHHTDKD